MADGAAVATDLFVFPQVVNRQTVVEMANSRWRFSVVHRPRLLCDDDTHHAPTVCGPAKAFPVAAGQHDQRVNQVLKEQ